MKQVIFVAAVTFPEKRGPGPIAPNVWIIYLHEFDWYSFERTGITTAHQDEPIGSMYGISYLHLVEFCGKGIGIGKHTIH